MDWIMLSVLEMAYKHISYAVLLKIIILIKKY